MNTTNVTIVNCADVNGTICVRCYIPYTGELCETTYMEAYPFYEAMLISYAVFCVVTSLMIILWSILGIRFFFVNDKKIIGSIQVIIATMVSLIIGNILRIIVHIDGARMYKLLPFQAFTWMYNLAEVLILISLFSILGIWMDLVSVDKVFVNDKFVTAKLITGISAVVFAVALCINLTIGTIDTDYSTSFVNNIIYISVLVLSSTAMIILGCMFLGKIKGIQNKGKAIKTRVTHYMIINGVVSVAAVAFIGVLLVINSDPNSIERQVLSLFSLSIFRIGEFVVCVTSLLIASRSPCRLLKKDATQSQRTNKTQGSTVPEE